MSAETETDKITSKIRALLNKAERTEFPEEAHALSAKAQELMIRFSIEEHQVRQQACAQEVPVTRTYYVPNPHGLSRLYLFSKVARSNICGFVQSGSKVALLPEDAETFPRPGVVKTWEKGLHRNPKPTGYLAYVTGFPSDLDAVWALYGSLLIQAQRELKKTPPPPGIHGKTWSTSFLVGYANQIGFLLRAARDEVVKSDETHSFLPVLLNKQQEVEAAKAKAFPRLLHGSGPTVRSTAGIYAGQAAANRADTGRGRLGTTRALSR